MKKFYCCIMFFLTSLCYADGWLESVEPDAYSGWACEFGNSGYVGIHVWRDDGLFFGGVMLL